MAVFGSHPKIASMWIKRDLSKTLNELKKSSLPIKMLNGPRQVGKTSLLNYLGTHKLILFDDLKIRELAQSNPSFFFDQFKGPLILDEATLAPEVFPEIKKRVDEQRRRFQKTGQPVDIDIWITGSNQTLLQKATKESLAGRANYYFLNTLSIHELKKAFKEKVSLSDFFMKGGWPELYVSQHVDQVHYLNDFTSTFIEKDIVMAAGIEKRAAFSKILQMSASRVGQLFNASDLAKNVGIDTTTVQSWISILEQNGVLRLVPPYYTNLNQRLVKTPKVYFEDVGHAVRLQGWTDFEPILLGPYFGHLFENLVFSEISRFFINQALEPKIYFVRSKEQVEVDLLLELTNQRFIAIEIKTTPIDLTFKQLKLLDSLGLNIVEKWIVTGSYSPDFEQARVISIENLFDELEKVLKAGSTKNR